MLNVRNKLGKKELIGFLQSFLVVALVFSLYYFGFVGAATTTVLTSPYSANNVNVTQNTGFAHLNISRAQPYYFASSGYGLVSYFNFDHNTSTTVYDLTKSRTGTLNGGLAPTTGIYGNALKFDGIDDYADLSSFTGLSGLRTGTMTGWFKLDPQATANTQFIFALSDKDVSTDLVQIGVGNVGGIANETFWYLLRSGSDSPISAYLIDNQNGSTRYQDNTWHHFAVRMGGSNFSLNNAIFIDGVSKTITFDSSQGNLTSYSFLDINNADTARFGGRYFNGAQLYGNLSVDEVMFFNRSLTDAQIQAIYLNQSPRFSTTGQQNFTDVVVASGDNKQLNLSFGSYKNFLDTNISVSVDGGATYTNLSNSGTLNNLDYTQNSGTLNISLIYHSNNNSFYTPEMIGNFTVNSWASTGVVITDPTSTNVKNLTPNQSFTVSFNYSYLNTPVTENVTVNNVTVGGVEAPQISGQTWYQTGGGWRVNVTSPSKNLTVLGYEDLILNATYKNGTANFTSTDIKTNSLLFDGPPLLNYTSPTPASGNIEILNRSFLFNETVDTYTFLKNLTWNFNGTNYSLYGDHLILFMNFDNRSSLGESSSLVVDLSRASNNGTPVANAHFVSSGKYGGAYNFDGSSDRISLPDTTLGTTALSRNLTISAWTFPTQSATNGFWYTIISKRQAGVSGFKISYQLRFDDLTGFNYVYGDGTQFRTCNYLPSGGIESNVWQHWAVTAEQNGSNMNVTIYKNGFLVSSCAVSGLPIVPTETPEIGSWSGDPNSPKLEEFEGNIDDLRVYDYAVSPGFVREIYSSQLTRFNSSYWYFSANESNVTPANYSYFTVACDVEDQCSITQRALEIQSTCNLFEGDNWNFYCLDSCVFNTSRIVPGNVTFNSSVGGGEINISTNWTFNNTNSYIFVDKGCQLNIGSLSGFNL